MPSPRKGESQKKFIARCMSSGEANDSFPDAKQRAAFCYSQWKRRHENRRQARDAGPTSEQPKPRDR